MLYFTKLSSYIHLLYCAESPCMQLVSIVKVFYLSVYHVMHTSHALFVESEKQTNIGCILLHDCFTEYGFFP